MKAFCATTFILVFKILICFEAVYSQALPAAEAPTFSHSSGFYSGSIQIALTVSAPNAIIRYTLDCSDPTEASPIYTEPIEIESTKVIRAKTYQADHYPSNIVSHTFILNQTFNIPTLSVITNPSNLWGGNGIYTNFDSSGANWERAATIEFFESNSLLEFSADVGLRIHGARGRASEKKSLRYYFRSEYGQSRLHHLLFKSKNSKELKRFVTSASFQDAPGNSAYGSGTLLRDAVLQEIGRRIQPDISLGTRPLALFLAGKPWGIYNAIERIDRYLVEINFGIYDCDIIENYSYAEQGTTDRWNEMVAFFESSDLSLSKNYEIAQSYIDIQNFTRYHLVEIYSGNMDWPDFNNIAFCGRNPGDKWKWILWDMDHAFADVNANTFKLATDQTIRGTIILIKLLENRAYRIYFLNECANFFNTILQPESVKAIIDSLAGVIRNDMAIETNRWGGSIGEWEVSVEFLKSFTDQRLDRLWQYILDGLDVEQKHLLTIHHSEGNQGMIRINGLYITQFPWEGYYVENIPVELEAMPKAGFKFTRWSHSTLPAEKKVTLILKDDFSIYPIYEPDNQNETIIIINEINYNSAPIFDPEDWVELYNPSDQIIDLSGWHLKDDNDSHDFKFPDGTVINPLGFLILCRNQQAFHNLFPDVINYIGDSGFGLSSSADAVRLYNSSYALIDSVIYDDKLPWPFEADGNGATLELIDPESDNSLPQNWRASPEYGSPGKPNRYWQQESTRQIKLKLIKGSLCDPGQGWENAIDGDVDGLEGTVKTKADSCLAIFAFENESLPTIHKFRLKTDSGIGFVEHWTREFQIKVSQTDLSSQSFVPVLKTEKIGGDWEEFSIAPIHARYIKFNVIQPDSGWRQVAEFEAWGCDSSVTSAVRMPMLNPGVSSFDDRFQDEDQIFCSNFPNPFNETTNIIIKLPSPAHIRIAVYNIIGEEIAMLMDDSKTPGIYQISWNGKDAQGFVVPSGIYLLQIRSDKFDQTRKIILMK